MPQVLFETAKGLHQKAGKGIRFQATAENQIAATTVLYGKDGLATGVDPYQTSTTQLFPLGTRLCYGDREYKYVKLGAGAVTAGKLLASPANNAHFVNKKIANVDAGTLAAISFTNGASAVAKPFSHAAGSRGIIFGNAGATDLAKDDFAEGYILINDEEGEGQFLRIRTHEAMDQSDRANVVIETYDPLTTTIVKNSSEASLIKHPCKDVVVAPATAASTVIGVTVVDMAAADFGWAVCKGLAAVLADQTLVIGENAVRSDGTAGAVEPAPDDVTQVIGRVHLVNGNTEYAVINLDI